MLVTMVLVGVLGAVVMTAVLISNRQTRIATDEATGLSDVRVVVERLGRDIRGSRGVDAGATNSTLVLWIDYNSDYVRSSSSQANEIVTWSVVSQGNGQFNTLRSTAGGQVQLQARTLVSNMAFCYLTAPSDNAADCLPTPLSATDAAATRLVKVTLQYDAAQGYGSQSRTTSFTERIRNVG
jgi:hypothetical protein